MCAISLLEKHALCWCCVRASLPFSLPSIFSIFSLSCSSLSPHFPLLHLSLPLSTSTFLSPCCPALMSQCFLPMLLVTACCAVLFGLFFFLLRLPIFRVKDCRVVSFFQGLSSISSQYSFLWFIGGIRVGVCSPLLPSVFHPGISPLVMTASSVSPLLHYSQISGTLGALLFLWLNKKGLSGKTIIFINMVRFPNAVLPFFFFVLFFSTDSLLALYPLYLRPSPFVALRWSLGRSRCMASWR